MAALYGTLTLAVVLLAPCASAAEEVRDLVHVDELGQLVHVVLAQNDNLLLRLGREQALRRRGGIGGYAYSISVHAWLCAYASVSRLCCGANLSSINRRATHVP